MDYQSLLVFFDGGGGESFVLLVVGCEMRYRKAEGSEGTEVFLV